LVPPKLLHKFSEVRQKEKIVMGPTQKTEFCSSL
jgi:hypothetical protein